MTKPFLTISTTQYPNPFDAHPDYEDLKTFTLHKHYRWGNDCERIEDLEADFYDENGDLIEAEFRKMIKCVRDGDPYFYKDHWYYPVFVLDHSGLSYSRKSFHDPWDSGLGFIVKADEDFKNKWQNLVDALNQFENGHMFLVQEIDLETGECLNCFEIADLDITDLETMKKELGCCLKNEYTNYEYERARHNVRW